MPRSHCDMEEDRSEVGGAGATESTTTAISTCSTSAAASPGGSKRGRDPVQEVYLDNFHSHKRYLSETMAVGDSIAPDNLVESTASSESACYLRDEIAASQYSPMSEDSADGRYCENNPSSATTTAPQSDAMSTPTSRPVSPHRHHHHQNPFTTAATGGQCPLNNTHHTAGPAAAAHSHPRQRASDSEGGRFPSSPTDMGHTIDLRRAALLRSVQMRTQPHCPAAASELSFSSGQENLQSAEEDDEAG